MDAWVSCSMRLGVPFIAPRELGAVGATFGRLWLPSVRGRTGQCGASQDSPVHHRTVNSARFLSFSSKVDCCHPLVSWHTGQSGATF
jgi:hypothetical protein